MMRLVVVLVLIVPLGGCVWLSAAISIGPVIGGGVILGLQALDCAVNPGKAGCDKPETERRD